MATILIIDDEKPTLQMLSLYLEACGHRVLAAENENQGLSLFKQEQPPIVLTDIKMPGKDGFDVLQQIKRHAPQTDVIVITGHGDKDLANKAFDMKASAFFNKPLDTDALDKAINSILERIAKGAEPS